MKLSQLESSRLSINENKRQKSDRPWFKKAALKKSRNHIICYGEVKDEVVILATKIFCLVSDVITNDTLKNMLISVKREIMFFFVFLLEINPWAALCFTTRKVIQFTAKRDTYRVTVLCSNKYQKWVLGCLNVIITSSTFREIHSWPDSEAIVTFNWKVEMSWKCSLSLASMQHFHITYC